MTNYLSLPNASVLSTQAKLWQITAHAYTRYRATLLLPVFVTLMVSGFSNKTMATSIPVVTTTCATCSNASDLKAAATTYFNLWLGATPPGYVGTVVGPASSSNDCGKGDTGATVLLIVSANAPLSGTFYACYIYPNGIGSLRVVPISSASDTQAISVDNLLLTRATETEQITLPANLPAVGSSNFMAVAGEYLQRSGLPLIGSASSSWHGLLTPKLPAVQQGIFVNMVDGQKFTLWNGDTVTVTDSKGVNAKFQWIPDATPTWQFVAGEESSQIGPLLPIMVN